jgi:hypothetical protein
MEAAVADGLRRGQLDLRGASPFEARAGLPDGARSLLRTDSRGRCVFYEPASGLCAIHRALGPAALPVACRHFPRLAVIAADGVRLSLSHYCPTAARLLFAEGPLEIVRDPPSFPREAAYDGLDVRASLGPLLRPGVLLGWDGWAAWEEGLVRVCAESATVEAALARLEAVADDAARWTPAEGRLADRIQAAFRLPPEAAARPSSFDSRRATWLRVRAALPGGVPLLPLPGDLAEADAAHVAPALAGFDRPLRRYLAAKGFASGNLFHADGLREEAAFLRAALDVVRVEAARACAVAGAALDEARLREAFRQADLLLVHLSAPDRLARACSPRVPESR